MRTNVRTLVPAPVTHQGGKAERQSVQTALMRAVSTCMLFEDTFYEGGDSIANRIALLCKSASPELIAQIAIHARNNLKLRHVPLWLLVQMLHNPNTDSVLFSVTCRFVIKRPDEMGELLALFTKNRKGVKKLNKLPNKLIKALAETLPNFSEYQLAKWNRDSDIKLRDIIRLTHPKPETVDQAALWKSVLDGTIATPDTWETALSAGADKGATFTRLLMERKLGYMALLMNLRNMEQANVDRKLVREALLNGAKKSVALPFRFITAARHAPSFAGDLSDAMIAALEDYPKLDGVTYLVVDVSGSMNAPISAKSQVNRLQTAGALAVLLREVGESVRVFVYSSPTGYGDGVVCKEVKAYHGMPLIEEVEKGFGGGGTYTQRALQEIQSKCPQPDRVILLTDEQAADGILPTWSRKQSYVVNVAPYQPGLDVTNNGWVRINGWSERLVEWIQAVEADAS